MAAVREVLDKMMKGVPENEKYQMVTGNCVDFFRLDGAEGEVRKTADRELDFGAVEYDAHKNRRRRKRLYDLRKARL